MFYDPSALAGGRNKDRMKPLMRVLKGVWPYRWRVLLGLLCALGVSLSYASGIATLLPVMKIFISTEGVHGWANQTAAESRLHIGFMNLDRSVQAKTLAVIISRIGSATPAPIRRLSPGDRITSVSITSAAGHAVLASHHWQGMMALLARQPDGTKVRLAIASSSGTAKGTAVIAMPGAHWYLWLFVDAIHALPRSRLESLAWVILVFIILCIVGSAFRYMQQYISMTLAVKVVINLRRRMHNRILQLPVGYFSSHGTTDLTSRLTQDTNILTEGLTTLLGKTMLEPMKALTVGIVALLIDWKICVGTMVILPIIGVIIRKFSKRMRRASRKGLEQWSDMLGIISETLMGIRIVKAHNGQGYERRRFTKVNRHLYRQQARLAHYTALSRPTIETLTIVLGSIPVLFAAKLVLSNSIGRDSFIFLLACFAAIFEPLRKLADVNSKLQQSNASATRIFEIIDEPVEDNMNRSLPPLARLARQIEFENVDFSYPGATQRVLHHVTFSVRKGQTVAIVGANGSGKSTLLSLIPRLLVPTSGVIKIDSVNTADISLKSLRKQIGLVTQDTILFADTVYNNIAYAGAHAPREAVLTASRQSYADEFIVQMPNGYDTLVGQSGMRLSGGQRQRIAIARAILRDPAILLLDEAMSQIDADSEHKINLALKEFILGRTTFVIAHRLSTIIGADLIVCLDHGEVIGVGTHAELMNACEGYQKICQSQFSVQPAAV